MSVNREPNKLKQNEFWIRCAKRSWLTTCVTHAHKEEFVAKESGTD